MTKLSDNFNLSELTASSTAVKLAIPNNPDNLHIKVLTHTCNYLLEPLRRLLADSYKTTVYINISSGYRCLKLNRALGSKDNSQHVKGEAVDFNCYFKKDNQKVNIPYNQVYEHIKTYCKKGLLSVDQCIQEKSKGAFWVHCSYSSYGSTKNRGQFLKYDGKSYKLDEIIK